MRDEAIGIAIACHNSAAVLERCLVSLRGGSFRLVVFDDGSRDSTADVARAFGAVVLRGDGTAWWTGGTRAALEYCFDRLDCEYGLLLNPDVQIAPDAIRRLATYVQQNPRTIAGALAVDAADETRVAWAGVHFRAIWSFPKVEAIRFVAREGTPVARVGDQPYETDELHGRGVLISRAAYREIGRFDAGTFPHYGGDSEYSFRARAAGYRLVILPEARCRLEIGNSGFRLIGAPWSRRRLRYVRDFLLERRSGEALRVLPALYFRHLPWPRAATATGYSLAASVLRRLTLRGGD